MSFDKGSMTSNSCPLCHQVDRVQKVSALVAAGTATGAFTGPTSGYVYGKQGGYVSGNTTLFGISQTTLSQQLSPPAQPTYKSPWGCLTVGLAICLFLWGFGWLGAGITYTILGLVANSTQDTASRLIQGVGLVILSIPVLFFAVKFYRSRQKQASSRRAQLANEEWPRWQKAYSKWEELYYCERDDGVFLPNGRSSLVPRAQMLGFLYS